MKKLFLSLILLVFLVAVFEVRGATAKANKPNILFILIDDMGWKDIACAGSSYYETPNIDKLASEGMRFTNAYSAAPVCTPSRGAIFSGKCPARTQLTTVFSGPSGPDDRLYDWSKYRGESDQYLEARNRHALPRTEFILPQALSEGGYRTGFFGKWHIGECAGYYPDQRGFHVAKGYRVNQHRSSRSHWMKDFVKTAVNLDDADKDAYVADVLTDECLEFITENKNTPLLAVLSLYLVHNPVQPKPDKLDHYKNKPTTDQNNPGYAAMVEAVDDSVGRVLARIKDLGLELNTMVIFTSDNGGLTLKNTSNYPLMGGKSFPLEAGMKVPFIVKWPGKIKPGISKQRIIGMDIYPTMLSAAGLPLRPQQHLDGVDLMGLLTQNSKLASRPVIFHYPHYTHATGPFSSIIADNWKLIRFYNDTEGAYLLYNLNDDPEEQNDLSNLNPEKRDTLARKLSSMLVEMGAEMPVANSGWNAELVRKKPRFDRNGWVNEGHFTSKSTVELAKREREMFESRLKKKLQTFMNLQADKTAENQ